MTIGQIRRRHCPRRSDWLEQSTGRRKTNASDKDADFDRCHLRARRQMGRHLFASLNGHATLRAASAPEGRRSGSCGTGIYLSRAAWVGNAWVGYTQVWGARRHTTTTTPGPLFLLLLAESKEKAVSRRSQLAPFL
ncbi:Hypothetical protein NTJ_05961 [Nesidiocoris tenuis]|uniref:Uncharacterized protein n=1 Tax=Nesidiocoris tenuis TaxID=355587 RepID=A0ABN7APD0_9HEMI|nr:Hypothetical protein NTJ_05961 [Nesidiocoris tenuis]